VARAPGRRPARSAPSALAGASSPVTVTFATAVAAFSNPVGTGASPATPDHAGH
jgi:hypothetical protein